jgi:hypothetical protein
MTDDKTLADQMLQAFSELVGAAPDPGEDGDVDAAVRSVLLALHERFPGATEDDWDRMLERSKEPGSQAYRGPLADRIWTTAVHKEVEAIAKRLLRLLEEPP